MRPTLPLIALLLGTFPATGQTVDLSKWTVEQLTGTGFWGVTASKSQCVFFNSHLADRSVFYSNATLPVINFRLRVATVGDDDFIGFVLGFKPGDGKNKSADYLLVDWKQGTQGFGNWGTANAGMALSRVTGVGTTGASGGSIDFWSHTGVVKELARGTVYGQKPWADNTWYSFRVIWTSRSVDIWVDGVREFKVTGKFQLGRFGCYNLSQSAMEFQFPVAGSFVSFGQGCKGTAGTPVLSAPRPPLLGQKFTLQLTKLPRTGTAALVLGVSKSMWGAIPLPFNMGLIGGTGCTLYASADFLLPVTNQNGTGAITLPIPIDPGLLLFPFYCQATVIDGRANPLGMILSNGAEGRLGIQ